MLVTAETLGKYPLRRIIAQGSTGIVYESVDPHSQMRVALKVLRPELLDSPSAADFRRRFQAEVQVAERLTHPGIVAVLACGEESGRPYIVMEYVEGRSLRDCLERRVALDVPQSVNIMAQLLQALQYAHERGVCHRDIKPSNILITPDGQVKVADFGIAIRQPGGTDEIIGTPGYAAPETYLSDRCDGRADLFAAGAVLYELLTGVAPFGGTAEKAMFRTCHETPLTPSEVTARATLQPYDWVVMRALAKRPEERFSCAAEFRQALLQPWNQLGQPNSCNQPVFSRDA